MTDITELAHSLKAAAEKATPGHWRYLKTTPFMDAEISAANNTRVVNLLAGDVTKANSAFIAQANPANVLALVEALEKAQTKIIELQQKAEIDPRTHEIIDLQERIIETNDVLCNLLPDCRYMDPPDGGSVTPLEQVSRMVAGYRQRIAGLESRAFTAAAADLMAERQRQVTTEGWAPAHDDEYEHGELADAAGCYALSSEPFDCAGEPPRPWPWPDEWWKPTSRRRDLVKAGALILAEIERIDRAAGVDVREAE